MVNESPDVFIRIRLSDIFSGPFIVKVNYPKLSHHECHVTYTGALNLKNAMKIFRRHPLARRNYLAKMLEIFHDTLLGDSAWDSQGIFGYLIWAPRKWVPFGSPGDP